MFDECPFLDLNNLEISWIAWRDECGKITYITTDPEEIKQYVPVNFKKDCEKISDKDMKENNTKDVV